MQTSGGGEVNVPKCHCNNCSLHTWSSRRKWWARRFSAHGAVWTPFFTSRHLKVPNPVTETQPDKISSDASTVPAQPVPPPSRSRRTIGAVMAMSSTVIAALFAGYLWGKGSVEDTERNKPRLASLPRAGVPTVHTNPPVEKQAPAPTEAKLKFVWTSNHQSPWVQIGGTNYFLPGIRIDQEGWIRTYGDATVYPVARGGLYVSLGSGTFFLKNHPQEATAAEGIHRTTFKALRTGRHETTDFFGTKRFYSEYDCGVPITAPLPRP